MGKWILKLHPEETKFIEGVAVEYVDKSLSRLERDNCINLLNHMGYSKWGISKFKTAMTACRKQLGIKGKKGVDKGTKIPRPDKKPDSSPDNKTGIFLSPWEKSILDHVHKVIRMQTQILKEDNDRLRKERDEARLELRSLVKIKQAVEEIQDNHRKRG